MLIVTCVSLNRCEVLDRFKYAERSIKCRILESMIYILVYVPTSYFNPRLGILNRKLQPIIALLDKARQQPTRWPSDKDIANQIVCPGFDFRVYQNISAGFSCVKKTLGRLGIKYVLPWGHIIFLVVIPYLSLLLLSL